VREHLEFLWVTAMVMALGIILFGMAASACVFFWYAAKSLVN
jgi:hypothetical protein